MGFVKSFAVAAGVGLGGYGAVNTLTAPESCYLVLSCAPDKSFHPVTPGKNPVPLKTMFVENHGWDAIADLKETESPSIYRPTPFYKAWLEYNDAGKPFSPDQKNAILTKLEELKKNKKPVLVVTFIHGWHNNADDSRTGSEEDWLKKNSVKFDNFIARHADQMRRLYEQRGIRDIPTVLGVYVGWRGDSLTTAGLNFLTIGNRAAAADRLGSDRKGQNLYADLKAIADAARGVDAESRMLVVGHSLGGRVLSRLFLDDIVKGAKEPLGPNTLAVAIEPAIGADCFDDAFKATRDPLDKPAFISITSEHDGALSTVYKWGGSFLVKDCNPASHASGVTIGNHHDYLTHRITFTHKKEGSLVKPIKLPEDYDAPDGHSDYPRNASSKNWYQLLKTRTLAYTMTDLNCKPTTPVDLCFNKTSVEFYTMNIKVKKAFGRSSRVWNIVTDSNTIDIQKPPTTIAGKLDTKHNGYVSVNLTRILTEYMYPNTPKPTSLKQ